MVLFDYFYYRIYSFFKSMGDSIPEWKGILLLSLMQCLTVMDVTVFVDYTPPFKWFFLPLLVFVGAVNWSRYQHRFDPEKFGARWKDESSFKRGMKGLVVWGYLIISFLIPVVYGYLKHNVKVM